MSSDREALCKLSVCVCGGGLILALQKGKKSNLVSNYLCASVNIALELRARFKMDFILLWLRRGNSQLARKLILSIFHSEAL